MSVILAKYGVELSVEFPMILSNTVDFAGSGDWTPETGDVKRSLDGTDVDNATGLPVIVGGVGSKLWSLTLTASELQCKKLAVQIIDQSETKIVADNGLLLWTYGHPSSMYPDLAIDSALTAEGIAAVVNAAKEESYHVLGASATNNQLLWAILQVLTNSKKEGTTLTVRNQANSPVLVMTLNHPTNPTDVKRTS